MKSLAVTITISLFVIYSIIIEKTLDPILKTEMIFRAIEKSDHTEVRNAYYGLSPVPENLDMITANNKLIRDKFLIYGFPKKTQITVREEKVPRNRIYKHHVVGKTIKKIFITTTKIGKYNECIIETTLFKNGKDLEVFGIDIIR